MLLRPRRIDLHLLDISWWANHESELSGRFRVYCLVLRCTTTSVTGITMARFLLSSGLPHLLPSQLILPGFIDFSPFLFIIVPGRDCSRKRTCRRTGDPLYYDNTIARSSWRSSRRPLFPFETRNFRTSLIQPRVLINNI